MTNHFPPSALCDDYLSATFKNYDKFKSDHSRVPLATVITSNFTNAFDERTISDYESLHLDFFLVCVSYMHGHGLYVDGRDIPPENPSEILFDILILEPCCFAHSDAEDDRVLFRILRTNQTEQPFELDEIVEFTNFPEEIRPGSRETAKKCVTRKTCKKYVPIFGTYFSNVRSNDIASGGSGLIKEFFKTTYCLFSLDVACSSCQIERFFCNLYEENGKIRLGEKETDDSFEIDDSKENENDLFKGKKRFFRSVSTDEPPKKRPRLESNRPESGSMTKENRAVFEEIPEEIWSRILNVFLYDRTRTRIRAFLPEKDTLGSVTNYVSVHENANAIEDAGSDEFAEITAEFRILTRTRSNVLKNAILSRENATENMMLDDVNGLLDSVRSISSVCKSWNDRVKKHWCWRYVYQCVHTLYNSSRNEVVRELALSSETSGIDGKTRLYRLSKRVHGLLDCHVFASYAFNILSGILFETINVSVHKNKTDYKFRKHGVYHSLVRLICIDTIRNWNNVETSNDEFETLLKSCYDRISSVFSKTKIATENAKTRLNKMLVLASINISVEKKINVTV